jgi:uncharacterized membrane protein
MNTDTDNKSKEELRKFGLLTGGLIAGLFGLAFPFLFSRHYPVWPWVIGGALLAWALVLPASLASVYKYWMRFAHILGWVNTRIILGIIFFLLITPFGFVMRLFTRDPMARKFDAKATSYRVPSVTARRETIRRPF